jgi:hypothetical protein
MSEEKNVVRVSQDVEVTIDPAKFTPEFMAEFRESFFDFDTVAEHIEHLAQLHARGITDYDEFIEGYGPARDMGIRFKVLGTDIETVPA